MHGRQQAFVLARDWLPKPPARIDRDAALAELARRYLGGHGPAGEHNLAKWAGLPLRDARKGLNAIASELEERPDGLVDLADLAGRPTAPALRPPRLLARSTRSSTAGPPASRSSARADAKALEADAADVVRFLGAATAS